MRTTRFAASGGCAHEPHRLLDVLVLVEVAPVILDKLKAYGAIVLAAVLGALLLAQTMRLTTAQLQVERQKTTLAQTKQGHAEELKHIADLTAAAYQATLKERDTNNRKRQEALDANRLLEAALRGDLLRAATESERMRDQLTYAGRLLAANAGRVPPEVVAEYATTVGELLAICSRERAGFAAKADGHAADARLLHQSQ